MALGATLENIIQLVHVLIFCGLMIDRSGKNFGVSTKLNIYVKKGIMNITGIQIFHMLKIVFNFLAYVGRFHLLPEFDEGKKSCRSRLAKHNGRRRKAPAQAGAAGNTSSENQSLTNTLLLLLKQLSGQDRKFLEFFLSLIFFLQF